ncbi:hypothetical protein [Aggregatibacter kilianii]|uniref:hypothetical protein n=1 Tax=Aggregatibacter kilianii TaxID=2025884 RepID=UPI000D65260E|nr:hypothetical protein [Aggregatibacter kilianii]
MKKSLLVALVGAVLLSGCVNKTNTLDERSDFYKLDRTWNNSLTGDGLNKFKLFKKDEILISEKGNLSIYDDMYSFRVDSNDSAGIKIPTYSDLIGAAGGSQKKVTVESYLHIMDGGKYPRVAIYQKLLASNNIELKDGERVILVKFNCPTSTHDRITGELTRFYSNGQLVYGKILEVININGGQSGMMRYSSQDGKNIDIPLYASKEQANNRSDLFDKAKQIACGF